MSSSASDSNAATAADVAAANKVAKHEAEQVSRGNILEDTRTLMVKHTNKLIRFLRVHYGAVLLPEPAGGRQTRYFDFCETTAPCRWRD